MTKEERENLETWGQEMGRMLNTELRECNAYKNGTYFEKLDIIKEYYEREQLNILKTFSDSPLRFFDPYPFDWGTFLSPIELGAWHSIREKGNIVLYPQYPVLNYNLDFGNPGLKIALELDGKDFHDYEKDIKRDKKLKEVGWTVYRVTGSEMNHLTYKTWRYLSEEGITYQEDRNSYIRDWIFNSGDGVIEAIKTIHFRKPSDPFFKTDDGINFYYYCKESLRVHQLID